jgi:DNA-binding NarL/FixJ family response regulator
MSPLSVAIFSPDPVLRRSLEQMLRADPAVALVGIAGDPSDVPRLIDQHQDRVDAVLDAVLADAPPCDQLSDWRARSARTAFVVLLDGNDPEDSIEALHAGAGAILPRSAECSEIVAAIRAATKGLAVLPRALLPALLDGTALTGSSLARVSYADALPDRNDLAGVRLTPRELEVLAAMADGASNKAIALRLEISFHTAKFHVAAILAKLDADSRTEAVTRAAQLGLVML